MDKLEDLLSDYVLISENQLTIVKLITFCGYDYVTDRAKAFKDEFGLFKLPEIKKITNEQYTIFKRLIELYDAASALTIVELNFNIDVYDIMIKINKCRDGYFEQLKPDFNFDENSIFLRDQ